MSDRHFVIVTEEGSDLPLEYMQANGIVCMPMGFSVDDVDYGGEGEANRLSPKDFYDRMRQGAMTKTTALSADTATNTFRKLVQQGKDILYIAFSSGLSSTYNSGRLAKETVEQEYPEASIVVVDSLCASLGQGLLVYYAVQAKEQGKTLAQTASYVEDLKLHICHYFTVEDLQYLHRGGRVSKTTAIVGTVLGIKPVMHVNDEGKLIPIGKVRGRKKSLLQLVEKMGEKMGVQKNDIVFISHGDCEEDAKFVAECVKKKFGIKTFLTHYVGCTIGSHSGPGTLALFFVGDNRAEA